MTTAPAQDIIDALIVQRNDALNLAADANANLRATLRENADLREQVRVLEERKVTAAASAKPKREVVKKVGRRRRRTKAPSQAIQQVAPVVNGDAGYNDRDEA